MPHRLHVGHHWRAEGMRRVSSRRARDVRCLLVARAAAIGGRPLHRHAATRIHLRAGWTACIPHARARIHGAAGIRVAGNPARRHRGDTRDDHVHCADVLPAHGDCHSARAIAVPHRVAAPVGICRRSVTRCHACALARRHGHRDARRHRRDGDDAHLHRSIGPGHPARCNRQGSARLRSRRAWR